VSQYAKMFLTDNLSTNRRQSPNFDRSTTTKEKLIESQNRILALFSTAQGSLLSV